MRPPQSSKSHFPTVHLFRLFAVFSAALWSNAIGLAQTATLTVSTSSYAATAGSATFAIELAYTGQTLSALGATITLPTGWSFASASGTNVPDIIPTVGTTEAAEFAYTSAPANAATFSLTLNHVAGLSGNQTFAGAVHYKVQSAGSTPLRTIALSPLVLPPANNALPLITSALMSSAKVGTAYSYTPTANSTATRFNITGLPAGLTADPATGSISGTPANAGTFSINLSATNAAGTGPVAVLTLTVTADALPSLTLQPANAVVPVGGSITLDATVTGASLSGLQWHKNGTPLAGATGPSLTLSNFQISDAGSYTVVATTTTGPLTSPAAVVGVSSTAKVTGAGNVAGNDIVHPNGNVYDQILLTGSSATITADATQVTRISFIDLDDDIVQIEFSGAGTLTLTLENASDPAPPVKYHQPDVNYVKGHASLVITGADETSNVSVFSVGPVTAINQSLFKAGETYDGIADIGLISIATANGRFGGIRTANTSYFRAAGLTGIYAPGAALQGPVFVGEITADADATPVLIFGSTTDVRITGGDLLQLNNRPVQVDGITHIAFTSGATSADHPLPAQTNRARFQKDGADVTDQLVTQP